MRVSTPTIVIIGAGFSGAITAAHLLRNSAGVPLRIVMLNRSGRMARGVAYGTRSPHHVLNVPAGRMSAFASDEEDFLRFAQQRDPSITGGSFVPRSLYGQYLEHVLISAQAMAPRGTILEHVADEAVAVELVGHGTRALVELAGGNHIPADRVVLAIGNYQPSNPRLFEGSFLSSRRYVRDPWQPGALQDVSTGEPVLLIGTGLTMIDVAVALASKQRTAPILAISRRGLVPQPHRSHTAAPPHASLPPDLLDGQATAVSMLRSVRRHSKALEAAGGDWRDVVGSLRPITPELWTALDTRERARFLRHLRVYWDVHRHRLAPELWERVKALIADGSLSVRAARIKALREDIDGVAIDLTPRHGSGEETESLRVAQVINCTGPEGDVRALNEPLISYLILHGLVRPDALGLGLDVTDDLVLVGSDDEPSTVLSLVGPMLKGAFWEATAVPELRLHAARVASRLCLELAGEAAAAPA